MDKYLKVVCEKYYVSYSEKSCGEKSNDYLLRFKLDNLGYFQYSVSALRAFYGERMSFGEIDIDGFDASVVLSISRPKGDAE